MRLLVLLAVCLALPACDSGVEPPTGEPPTSGVAPGHAWAGASPLHLGLTAAGTVTSTPDGGPDAAWALRVAPLALWMTGVQDGELRGTVDAYAPGCGEGPAEPFRLVADERYTAEGWPVGSGAPTLADGTPRVYGDWMEWASFCTPAPGAGPGPALDGLRVNVAVFGYDDAPTRYVRYEISNVSGAPVADLRLGVMADLDVSAQADNGAAAWNPGAEVGYVFPPYGVTPASRGDVAGVALLQRPGAHPTAAFRVVEPGDGRGPGGYRPPSLAEQTLQSLQAYDAALRGLTNGGDPIVDPFTGAATPFMYPGDPVTADGHRTWRDGGRGVPDERYGAIGWDARVLVGAQPVDLAPAETVVLTAVIVRSPVPLDGADPLTRARDAMLASLAEARARPERWTFAPAP